MSSISFRRLGARALFLLSLLTCLLVLAFFYSSPRIAQSATEATTYYLSPTGNNSNAGTSASSPWATFSRAWQSMNAGDTLILLDGVYNQAISPTQSGSASSPITIRAQNDGKAILDGGGREIPIYLTHSYYVIEGIVARNGTESVVAVHGQYNTLRRVSAYNADTNGNSRVFLIQGENNLVEDCIAAGTGRKMMLVFMSQHNTVRRCFVNWQQWDGRAWHDAWPWGDGLDIYNASNNVVENVISYGANPTHHIGFVSQGEPSDGGGVSGNKVLGTMAIDAGRNADGQIISWGNSRPQPTEHTAMRDFSWPGQRSGFNLYEAQFITDNLLQDIYGWGNAGLGIAWVDNGSFGTSNNRLNRATMVNNGLDNPVNFGGIGVDALRQDLNNFTVENSKIETVQGGSAINGEGARLIHRYVNGVLMDGTNGQAAQSLWPWPMESRVQAELGISVNALVNSITDINTTPDGVPTAVPTTPTPITPTSEPTTSPAPSGTPAPPLPSPVPTSTPNTPSSRRVNLPYLGTWPPAQSNYTPSIFWFGKVDSTSNYADVRMAYYADHLEVFVHVIDRYLWYDTSPSLADITQWDAVTLYLDLAGTTKQTPTDTAFRFIKQLGNGSSTQAAYQGNGTEWAQFNGSFTTESSWRGVSPNDTTNDKGWVATLRIPYATLGLSAPPADGTIWGIAVALHDRDDAAGTSIPDQIWPETMNPLQPAQWGELHFGASTYVAQTSPSGQTQIRQGLAGVTVVDAGVGGHGNCGGEMDDWSEWGNANYAGYDQFNIQNQWDVSDSRCFSKYYITFPLDSLPAGKSVVSAEVILNMFGNAGYEAGDAKPSAIQVLVVNENWDEKTITWNNGPLAFENISTTWVDPIDDAHPQGAHRWDVSRAVERAYRLGQPLRLVFYSTDGDYHSGKYFWSSDVGEWNQANAPTLNVTWGEGSSNPNPDPDATPSPNDPDPNEPGGGSVANEHFFLPLITTR